MTETASGPIIIQPELLHPINEAETMAVFAFMMVLNGNNGQDFPEQAPL